MMHGSMSITFLDAVSLSILWMQVLTDDQDLRFVASWRSLLRPLQHFILSCFCSEFVLFFHGFHQSQAGFDAGDAISSRTSASRICEPFKLLCPHAHLLPIPVHPHHGPIRAQHQVILRCCSRMHAHECEPLRQPAILGQWLVGHAPAARYHWCIVSCEFAISLKTWCCEVWCPVLSIP